MNIRRDSQNAALLVHLAKGKKLTRLSALVIFGVQNITARIAELRDLTHLIVFGCSDITDLCRKYSLRRIVGITKTDANGQSYEEYSIPDRISRSEIGRYLSRLRRDARIAEGRA